MSILSQLTPQRLLHGCSELFTKNIIDKSKSPSLLNCLFYIILLLSLTYCFATPRWSSNDDIGMSMVAHGYGIAAHGAPTLIYSNIIWGYFVRLIPELQGVAGYAIASLSTVLTVASVMLYGLRQLGLSIILSISLIILVFAKPILFLDFTVNAGLLLVLAVVCFRVYVHKKTYPVLVLGYSLAFLSFLIRYVEFFLVLIVSIPIILWKAITLKLLPRIALATTDLPPISRTIHFSKKSINPENDGHENK